MHDVVRFSVGTLTAIPVPPPRSLSRRVTVPGILVAPLAVLPLGALVCLVAWSGRELGLAPLPVAAAAVAALALGSRAFHLDGLADTADALTSSHDAARSLEVMKRGDTGPAGAAAVTLTLAVQVGGVAALLALDLGPVLAGALVCCSRATAAVLSLRGIPSARTTGLAASYVGAVAPPWAALQWLALTAALGALCEAAGLPWWRAAVCALVALAATGWLIRRAVRRLGGVAGDVYGAAIEVSLALMLLAAT